MKSLQVMNLEELQDEREAARRSLRDANFCGTQDDSNQCAKWLEMVQAEIDKREGQDG